MVRQVKVRKAGGSLAANLPKDLTDRFHIQAGDSLFAVETENGILLTPHDPNFEKGWEIYQKAAHKYGDALRELAK